MFEKNLVQNVPEYAHEYKVWVATLDDNGFWFYGAYDTMVKAVDVAVEIGGYTCV